ncbi:MAG: hypothetical protein ABIQ15_03510 [Nocardioides sp.]
MANVNLPLPLFVAAGGFCVLAGFLVGVVAGPETPDRTTGIVESYDSGSRRLCLTGDGVADREGADDEGGLCGTWRRSLDAAAPKVGDDFRFVTVQGAAPPEGTNAERVAGVLIYGDVVD